MSTKRTEKSLILRMPQDLHDLIKEISQKLDISMNQIILEVLVHNLTNWGLGDPDREDEHKKLMDIVKNGNHPDWDEKLANARFTIKHGMSIEEWNQKLVDSGYLERLPGGGYRIIGHTGSSPEDSSAE